MPSTTSPLQRVISLAEAEKWEEVDALVPSLTRDDSVLRSALDLLDNRNPNLRDLGATLLAKAGSIPSAVQREMPRKLYSVMVSNPNGYDGFRAACALAVHAPNYHTSEVRERLHHFEKDDDKVVAEVAREYLGKLPRRRVG